MQYLCNLATFTKIYLKNKTPEKCFLEGTSCCHGNQIFGTMFSQILTFLIFFLLIGNFFKTNANSLSQTFYVIGICDLIGIVQHLFQIQDGGQVLFTVSKLKAFSRQCAF